MAGGLIRTGCRIQDLESAHRTEGAFINLINVFISSVLLCPWIDFAAKIGFQLFAQIFGQSIN